MDKKQKKILNIGNSFKYNLNYTIDRRVLQIEYGQLLL